MQDTNKSKVLKTFFKKEKNKMFTLSFQNNQYIVMRLNIKTGRMTQYFFEEEKKALKKYNEIIGDGKNGKMDM